MLRWTLIRKNEIFSFEYDERQSSISVQSKMPNFIDAWSILIHVQFEILGQPLNDARAQEMPVEKGSKKTRKKLP